MAKNQITGKVAKIYDKVTIPTKKGTTFEKRELILDCSTFDRYTGDVIPNYVLLEFSGNKCDILNDFKKDDRVTVSFVLQGSVYKDEQTQTNRVITHAIGYECVPYVERTAGVQQSGMQQSGTQQPAPQQSAQAPQPSPQPAPIPNPQAGAQGSQDGYGAGADALPF